MLLIISAVLAGNFALASPKKAGVEISLAHSISEVGTGRLVFESRKKTIMPPSSAKSVSQAPALIREACTEQFAKHIDSSVETIQTFLKENLPELRETIPNTNLSVNFVVNIMKTSSKLSSNPNANKCFLEVYLIEDAEGLSVGCSILDYDLETHVLDFHDDRVKSVELEKDNIGNYIAGYLRHYYWPHLLELATHAKKVSMLKDDRARRIRKINM